MALFHGGLVQLLGGLWEIYVGNVFAATAFCSYGGFWMSFGFFVAHMIDNVPQEDMSHVVCVGVGVGVGVGVSVSLFLTLFSSLSLSSDLPSSRFPSSPSPHPLPLSLFPDLG